MPTYDYFCTKCQTLIEAFQKITDKPLTLCESCHQSTLVRKPSGGAGLILSGDGFYATMYGDKPAQEAGKCCPCGKTSGCETK